MSTSNNRSQAMPDFEGPASSGTDAEWIDKIRARLIEQGYDPDEVLSPPGAWRPYRPRPFPKSSDLTAPLGLRGIEAIGEIWLYFKERRADKKRTEFEISAWKAGRASGLASGLTTGRAVERATIRARLKEQGINLDDLLPLEQPENH